MAKKCSTPTCSRGMQHPQSGLCSACYSGIHYWMRQGVTRVIQRKTQLRILEERLDDLRPANVVHLRRRRAKAA